MGARGINLKTARPSTLLQLADKEEDVVRKFSLSSLKPRAEVEWFLSRFTFT